VVLPAVRWNELDGIGMMFSQQSCLGNQSVGEIFKLNLRETNLTIDGNLTIYCGDDYYGQYPVSSATRFSFSSSKS
jgi:hypothetical protein